MRTKGAQMAGRDGDKALRRIIQMLIALATLAERASGAPWPIRCLVLLFLRPAEAAAGGYVREVAQMPLGILDLSALPDDNSPAGALRLALCFRALAAVLQYLLRQPRRFAEEIRRIAGLFAPWNAEAAGLASIIAGVSHARTATTARQTRPHDTS